MTQDEIIEMAREADAEADNVLDMIGEYHPNWYDVRDGIFAKLVAAKERKAMLDLVDSHAKNNTDLADAIKARGQA